MLEQDDMLKLLHENETQAIQRTRGAVIIQPGALGDCILTLPLAEFAKNTLKLGAVNILGHCDYISFLPGRSCIDGVRSIETTDLHRLFVDSSRFQLPQADRLINLFSQYAYIVSFLGGPESNFETNLIYTANCSHSAEVFTIPLKPTAGKMNIADFYIHKFAEQSGLEPPKKTSLKKSAFIKPENADFNNADYLLRSQGIYSKQKITLIHPGSGGTQKCWNIHNFIELADKLNARKYKPVFLLGPVELERLEKKIIRRIKNKAPCLTNLPIDSLPGILGHAHAFIGNDCGITHLAAAMGVKTLALFGPTDSNLYRPIGPDVFVFNDRTQSFGSNNTPNLSQKTISALLQKI